LGLVLEAEALKTVVLLSASNIFMTFAWYGHLRWREIPLWQAVLASWGIALAEYCLMVPANRLGYGRFSGYQLKLIQEVITISIFIGFAMLWLKEPPRWNYLVAFALVLAAVGFAFWPAAAKP
jgi:uncharacterized protein (DUF486 family)